MATESTPLLNDTEKIPFDSMCNNSALMYSFQSLREIVNNHSVTFGDTDTEHEKVTFVKPQLIVTQLDEKNMETRPNAYLKNSVTAAEMLEFLQLNRNYYNEDLSFNEEWKLKTAADTAPLDFEDELEVMANKYDAEFWEYDDQFQDSELVYGVIVNRAEERIVIGFRGSATIKDFLVDATAFTRKPEELQFGSKMGYVPEDMKVSIHMGFNDYLFADGKKNDDRGTKFEDVLRDLEDVYSYKDDTYDYSTYKLFITGHSLGGALASLLTVALAGHEFAKTRPAILPVTCISYASPRAGCYSFKLLHKAMEKAKLIRHIRISNQHDVVPVGPFIYFYQTGVNIYVREKAPALIGYEVEQWCITQLRFWSLGRHSLSSYLAHLHYKAPNKARSGAAAVKVNKRIVLDKSVKDLYAEHAGFDV